MPLLKSCGLCRWSSPTKESPDNQCGMLDCVSDKFLKGYRIEVEDFSSDAVHVENDEGWGFTVGPDFGCIHFRERSTPGPRK